MSFISSTQKKLIEMPTPKKKACIAKLKLGSKSKKKKQKISQHAVVYEEAAPTQPFWMSKEEQKVVKPKVARDIVFLRPGIARGLEKLKHKFYVVILLQKTNTAKRQKQIFRTLKDNNVHFDAVYQHTSPFSSDRCHGNGNRSRFFSIDKILKETGFTPSTTIFMTSVD